MKLAKALKLKNQIAGKIAQTQRLISESNVTEGGNKSPHDVKKLYAELVENQTRLANLKGKIAIANGPISTSIAEMAELKGRIAFLRGLSTRDGTFMSDGRYGQESRPREYHATLGAAWAEEQCAQIETRVEQLQDYIDEFNATTSISE